MSENELVAELRELLENLPTEKLDELLSLLRAESARSGGKTSPCPAHLMEE